MHTTRTPALSRTAFTLDRMSDAALWLVWLPIILGGCAVPTGTDSEPADDTAPVRDTGSTDTDTDTDTDT
ncbi:MAG: hypothetical protein QGG40_16655, partial [Myxococcota bacterium]|nr:hypothetical protein [Myxococcota bacterium]